ncbi:MAG: DUF362 domain-containing protein [Deltaproteobacteria bacterium]|nr:DUF362 domain-containing protein [Candidatus Zymogenaceae bacterium]
MREIEVALVRVPENKRDNETAVREKFNTLIDIAGGLSFVKPGDSVLIKASVNSGRPYPATTDPKIVTMLIDLLVKKNPSAIFVGDKSAFFRNTKRTFRRTGMESAVRTVAKTYAPLPIKLICFDDYVWRERYPKGDMARQWEMTPGNYLFRMPKMLYENDPYLRQQKLPPKVDHIIVLANVKTHVLSGFTLAMKSYVGFMDDESRYLLHTLPHRNFFRLGRIKPFDIQRLQERIAEIHALTPPPKLVILDGRQLIVTGGPDSNNRIQPLPSFRKNPYAGIMLAGSDVVAMDAAGVALLKTQKQVTKWIRRHSIWEMPIFKRARELGLGATQADQICLNTDSEDELFVQMAWYLQ